MLKYNSKIHITLKQPNHLSLKAQEKRWVFNRHLISDTLDAVLIDRGRVFHHLGPATENALSPLHFSLVLGPHNICVVWDLSDLTGLWTASNSEIYWWARQLTALYTKSNILNSIRYCSGNQCSERKIGVICTHLRLPISKRAAAFLTNWSRFTDETGKP